MAPPTSPSTVTTLAPTRTALVSTVTEIYAIDATLVLFPLRRTRGGPKKQFKNQRLHDDVLDGRRLVDALEDARDDLARAELVALGEALVRE